MGMTRRGALTSLSALAVAASVGQISSCAEMRGNSGMRPLGIQLYMLNEPLEQDFQGTLNQVAAIGYREVEFAGFHNRTGAQLRQALDQAGLICPSMHVALEPLFPGMPSLQNPAILLDEVAALGATQLVVPTFPLPERFARTLNIGELMREPRRFGAAMTEISRQMTAEDWTNIARRLNEAGSTVARLGLHVGYHNHNLELARLGDATPLEILMRESDPALVSFELDVGWAASAGVDPAAFLRLHARRITQLHLKDAAEVTQGGVLDYKTADLGAGIINWPDLLGAVRDANIEHVYVEQEEPFKTSPMDAARTAFSFLQNRPKF